MSQYFVDQLSLFIKEASKNPDEVNTAITRIIDESDYRNFMIPKMVFLIQKNYFIRVELQSLQVKTILLDMLINTFVFMHLIKII